MDLMFTNSQKVIVFLWQLNLFLYQRRGLDYCSGCTVGSSTYIGQYRCDLKLQLHLITLSVDYFILYWRAERIPRGLRIKIFPSFGFDNIEFKGAI